MVCLLRIKVIQKFTPIEIRTSINEPEPVPPGVEFHRDHIFPKARFNTLKGYNSLSSAQKAALLKDPRNFQPLNASMNCSKGCKVVDGSLGQWDTYKGRQLNAGYKEWLQNEQSEMKVHLEQKIEELSNGR